MESLGNKEGRRISSSTEEFEAVEGTLSMDSCLQRNIKLTIDNILRYLGFDLKRFFNDLCAGLTVFLCDLDENIPEDKTLFSFSLPASFLSASSASDLLWPPLEGEGKSPCI